MERADAATGAMRVRSRSRFVVAAAAAAAAAATLLAGCQVAPLQPVSSTLKAPAMFADALDLPLQATPAAQPVAEFWRGFQGCSSSMR